MTLQQLTLITANHQPLVQELLKNKKISSAKNLVELTDKDWQTVIDVAGIPSGIVGENDNDKKKNYIAAMKGIVCAAFPTAKILHMMKSNELPIADNNISTSIKKFLDTTETFDFSKSRVHDFSEQIRAAAPEHHESVTRELKRMQRIFQISPNPKTMSVLMEYNLDSAQQIASYPRKSFIQTFGGALGGDDIADGVYQRSSHANARAEQHAMKMMEMSHGATPSSIMSDSDYEAVTTILENQVPNYSTLFGSPDICECDHCRSVYSAAAYFVDLLRFLWRGSTNSDGKSPLDMLTKRRPDLLHLPLTCENTNTIIPYIDLVNEVMEYYTVHGNLDKDAAYDTGDISAPELRASPQHFNPEAYNKLNNSVYPFTLPYHQPLDVIRTYGEHLKTGRNDVMRAMQVDTAETTERAIAAESLHISPEEYAVLTGHHFNDSNDSHALHQYFGYPTAAALENMAQVQEFLRRSGIQYTDLVELIKTRFINPHQKTLDFLQDIFGGTSVPPSEIYASLEEIEAGTFNPGANDPILEALDAAGITLQTFTQWVNANLDRFRGVITLFQPDSKCDLDTTSLRTLGNVYEGINASGITPNTWSKIHRFIRLWRKLGWTIHEVDLILSSLGEINIAHDTISKLSFVLKLKEQTKRPLNEIAAWWGNIDTDGGKSLYKKLFLNKAVQQIDDIFQPDAWGNYLDPDIVSGHTLAQHSPAIMAAFRMSEEDLQAVINVASIKENGTDRLLTLEDNLTLANLSTIYRHVVLAKALKLKVTDFCMLIKLFVKAPFSIYSLQQNKFVEIDPERTVDFVTLALSVKDAKFKSTVLQYIFTGQLPAESTLGLNADKTKQTLRAIRESFAAINQEHAEKAPTPLTAEVLQAKLSLTYQPAIVSQLMSILNGTVVVDTITQPNLAVAIPEELSLRYSYKPGSGRITATGIITDGERTTLKGLPGVNADFEKAIDDLYTFPETFLDENFSGVFTNLSEANAILLNHPEQPTPSTLPEKLEFVYTQFIPLLKTKLRHDAIIQHIASITGLSEESAAVLIKPEVAGIVDALIAEGHTATYYADTNFNVAATTRLDQVIAFDWGLNAPDAPVPPQNFSARWRSYLAAPASGEYTIVIPGRCSDS
jgi:hypothetical protein